MKAPLALALCATAVLPAFAHDPALHAPGAAAAVDIGAEQLAIPNLPVADATGATAGLRDRLRASPAIILTFAYTSCTDLCDIATGILLGVQALAASEGRTDVTLVTLTIDPARDTPDQLARAAGAIGAGPGWLWLTAGTAGTPPLLEALRFPAGPLESHDIVFLVGHPCTGSFTRILGIAEPEALLAATRPAPSCGA